MRNTFEALRSGWSTIWSWVDKTLYFVGLAQLADDASQAIFGKSFIPDFLGSYVTGMFFITLGALVTAYRKTQEAKLAKGAFELHPRQGKRGVSLDWLDATQPSDDRALTGYENCAALLKDVVTLRFYAFFDVIHHGTHGETLAFAPQVKTDWRLFELREQVVETVFIRANMPGKEPHLFMVGESHEQNLKVEVTMKVSMTGNTKGFRVMGGLSQLALVFNASDGCAVQDYRIDYDVNDIYRQMEDGLTEVVARPLASKSRGAVRLRPPALSGAFGIVRDIYS